MLQTPASDFFDSAVSQAGRGKGVDGGHLGAFIGKLLMVN
jgi:hypothetical protein